MMTRFLFWLTSKLPARAINGDDGEPYLERYFLCSFLGATAYIHRFVASDPDRGLHDHPWGRSLSLVLAGGYREVRRCGTKAARCRSLKPWRLNYIRGGDFHRIVLDPGKEAWTLFLHGSRKKGWGFLRNGKYTPHAQGKDDYPLRQWWATAPSGRELRARRHAELIEEAAAIIDGEALALRQCSTTGPNFDNWTGEDDALDTYKHWKETVDRLYAFADQVRWRR
jgi:hypothetical protein